MQGIIVKLIGGIYTVLDKETGVAVACQARGKFRAMKLDKNSSFQKRTGARTKIETTSIKLSPKVGDTVTYNDNTIMDIMERKNELVRPEITNVDQAILVFAVKEPEFSFVLLDRFLALIIHSNVKPVLIVSKIDMLDKEQLDTLKEKLSYYEPMLEVYYTSSKNHLGIKDLEHLISDKISVFTGQTGVGKSSLINELIPGFHLETQEISQALGRGKHTTRCTSLYSFLGGMIADTPGFGSLDYGNMTVNELEESFLDFHQISHLCRFNNCLHLNEPGCMVEKMAKEGKILKSRYENYLKFVDEVKGRKIRY